VTEKVCEVLRKGGYRMIAAKAAGISWTSFKSYMVRGAKAEEPFATFAAAVKNAETDCEGALSGYVYVAASDPKYWTAAMALLERRWPGRWARRDRIDPRAASGVPQFETAAAAVAYMERVLPALKQQAESEKKEAA
jgi:hypothetical protein